MITFDRVSKTFSHPTQPVQVLSDVSHNWAPGAVHLIMGPSGSGKTTLLLIAGGLLSPDQGRIIVQEKDVYNLSYRKRCDFRALCVGFVFQQFCLIPYLNVLDNVMLPTLPRRHTEPLSSVKKRATELLELLQLAHRSTHLPEELSIGERQRTSLARALLTSPPILLADEPTGNLDDENAHIVIELLSQQAKQGRTVIVATHDRRWTTSCPTATVFQPNLA